MKPNDRRIGVFKQSNRIIYIGNRGPKQILLGSPVPLGQREVSTRLDRESVQALEAAQNPRLTGKEMTATKKPDPKQTHASEGAMKVCAIHRGRDNLKFQASARLQQEALKPPHADCQNTPGTNPQTINAQTTGPEHKFMESSDRKQQ